METFLLYFPIFITLYVLTNHILNKIQNLPPSPFPTLPIIGHLHLLKRPTYRTLSTISSRNGPVLLLRFGSRRVLLVSSPSAAEECFTRNDIVFANRPRLLIGKYMAYNYTGLAWAPYGDHWRNLRRIASLELLSSTRLQMLSNIRVAEIRSLTGRIFRNTSLTVDLKKAFFELTMNIMMRMIAGKRYYGEEVADLEEAKRFKDIHTETFKLSGETNIQDFLPWIKTRKLQKAYTECREKRDKFMQNLIEERRGRMRTDESDEKSKTLIEVLLGLQDTDPEYYSDDIIKGLIIVLLLAGTDTTVNTMEWAFSLLLNHPEVLEKAQTEIDNRVGNDRLIEESDIAHLPYLSNIINETMRMYPPAPLLVPHESSDECMVAGFRVPRGTMLLVNIWAIHNDPKIWMDPGEFNPDRFEDVDGPRDGFKFMPFGSGRRGCPGEGLALRMIGMTLGSLIQVFDWERNSKEMVNMSEGLSVTLPRAHPLLAQCQPRPTMVNFLSQI